MEFLKNIDFPDGIAPVDTLLKAAPKYGQPVVLVQQGETETALEIPAGEEMTLVEILAGGAQSRFDVLLGEKSRLNHIRIVAEGADTQYRAVQHDSSTLELSTIVLGRSSENTYTLDCHQSTHTSLFGMAMPQGAEQVKNHIRLYHKKPLGQSYQTFKYVADGQSKAVFDGKIIVEKNAQKIQAYQKNNNILLSASARIETDPQLEIYADDVRCSHGATIGQLDQTALFYMRSRGIPYQTARRMLIRSFMDEALAGVRIDWLNWAIEKIISQRLG